MTQSRRRLSWVISLAVLNFCTLVHAETTDLYRNAMQLLSQGEQDKANEALTRLIEQEPQHAGAWLDLAITQCALGHAAEAERLFQAIESRFSPPPGILEVIASHRAQGCKDWQPTHQNSIMLARGGDNNVNQGASSPNFSIGSGSARIDLQLLPEYLPQRDQYTLLSTDYKRDVNKNGSAVFVQLKARKNDTLERFDTTSLLLGLERPWRFGNWAVQGVATTGFLTLGNKLYQQQNQLQARIFLPFKLPNSIQLSVLAGLTHFTYPMLPNFNSNTSEMSALLAYQGESQRTQVSAGYLYDSGKTGRLGGDRQGWFAGIQTQASLTNKLNGELSWTRQHWQSQAAYAPLIDQTRNQDTQLLQGTLIIPLKNDFSLQIEARKVGNQENISLFQYNSRLWQISLHWKSF